MAITLDGTNGVTTPDLTVDTDTLTVDTTNNRVGIGTANPSANLNIKNTGEASILIEADSDNDAGEESGFLEIRTDGGAVRHRVEALAGVTNDLAIIAGATGTTEAGVSSDVIIQTKASGASATERMRISSSGNFGIGTNTTSSLQSVNTTDNQFYFQFGFFVAANYNDICGILNRQGNDGALLYFRQAGTTEGNIAISGTTVSLNGAHLSRWSQLADNTRDESILKGTVMSNLDQMAEWTTDGVTEENEQLNCMKVSDVEGDPNVAGVFVNWDDDDDIYTNDMNVAMTGDMVIRIAQGVTVQRGDLLMSAGDGTAKPQGDDIVRSKTIAKVTSTTVSNTYDDGSYLVPCVLMAC
jgi:hypothetical protein